MLNRFIETLLSRTNQNDAFLMSDLLQIYNLSFISILDLNNFFDCFCETNINFGND